MSGWFVKVTTQGISASTRPLVEVYAVNIPNEKDAVCAISKLPTIDDQEVVSAGVAPDNVLAAWKVEPGKACRVSATI